MTKSTKAKKSIKNLKKQKAVTMRKSRRNIFVFLGKKWRKHNRVFGKEQLKCLHRRGYEKRYFFCYIWSLLVRYFKATVSMTIILIVIGIIFASDFYDDNNFNYLETQTNIFGGLTRRIQGFFIRVDDREKCISDRYWLPHKEDVCNYYLYRQKNEYCRKFNVPTERVNIGTKICCDGGNAGIYAKNKDKLTSCVGANIFFKRDKKHPARVVADKGHCTMNVCEFYPKDGWHAKRNKNGVIIYDKNGNIILEKDCEITQGVGPCNKACGGGIRMRYIQTKNCLKIKTSEVCNMEPCTQESY